MINRSWHIHSNPFDKSVRKSPKTFFVIDSMFPFLEHQKEIGLGIEAFLETTMEFWKNFFKICRQLIAHNFFKNLWDYRSDTDKSVYCFMVSWFIFENRSDVGTFKSRWEFWRIYWVIKLNTNSVKYSAFSFKIFTRRSVSWETLVVLKPLISFKTVFLSMQEKLNLKLDGENDWWK